MTTPPITSITGGATGLAASYAEVRSLADRFASAGDRMRGWAATGGRVLTDADLIESAPLSPLTFAEAEVQVLAATTGPHGVLVESVVYEADATVVRATVGAFEECDLLVRDALRAVDYLVGRSVGFGLGAAAPALAVAGVVAGPAVGAAWRRLPGGVQQQARTDCAVAANDLQAWLDEHPELVQHVVDGSGGLLDGLADGLTPSTPGSLFGLATFTPTTGAAAGVLAATYAAEGPPRVSARPDLSVLDGTRAPGSLLDVIDHLAQTNALSPADRPGDQGTIEVQTIHGKDGGVRYVVYLPGTDDLGTTPFSQDGDVRDLATNLHLVAGEDTTYEQGIRQAMTQAGIRPGDPVLLAGHSQGGMEAAAMLSHGTQFHVTNVVTAGSPTAQVAGFPPGTHVLSLENQGDVVPLLDGRDNPDSVQQVTVRFDDHETSIAGNHDLTHYAHGAAAVDASSDPSIREQLASLRAHGFLGGATATSQVFQITR